MFRRARRLLFAQALKAGVVIIKRRWLRVVIPVPFLETGVRPVQVPEIGAGKEFFHAVRLVEYFHGSLQDVLRVAPREIL